MSRFARLGPFVLVPILLAGVVAWTSTHGGWPDSARAKRPAQAPPPTAACFDLKAHPVIDVRGQLSLQTFPGPPNYESIANGDAREDAYILKLPRPACADDGESIEADTPFDEVHVYPTTDAASTALRQAIGKTVTVHGEAFGANTAHHRAPLVLGATNVTP